MDKKKSLKVKCPECNKEAVYSKENPFRPFCSEKCRLIDLNQWFDDDYCIGEEDHFISEYDFDKK